MSSNVNRPFLTNFLAAFRAHSATLPKPSGSLSAPSAAAVSAASVWSTSAYTSPTTAPAPSQSAAGSASKQHRTAPSSQPQPSPSQAVHTVDVPPALQHNVSPRTHAPLRSGSASASPSPPPQSRDRSNPYGPQPSEPRRIPGTPHSAAGIGSAAATAGAAAGHHSSSHGRSSGRRRGSDSSSDDGLGFRDVAALRGGERWYIGGRTAGGEERYYKLSLVRRETSADRLSADRLSL